jgi:carbon storage regulator
MLVLSRQRDQETVITTPDGVRLIVIVVDIRGDKVRLGFKAPPDVVIDRLEVSQIKEGAARG